MIRLCGEVEINVEQTIAWRFLVFGMSLPEARQEIEAMNRRKTQPFHVELSEWDEGRGVKLCLTTRLWLRSLDIAADLIALGSTTTLLQVEGKLRTIVGWLTTFAFRFAGRKYIARQFKLALADIKYRAEANLTDFRQQIDEAKLPISAVKLTRCR
jgi:hypothetical protein